MLIERVKDCFFFDIFLNFIEPNQFYELDSVILLTDCCKTTVDPLLENRDNHELELDFKRLWEEFRSSSSEKVLTLIIHTFVYSVNHFSGMSYLQSWDLVLSILDMSTKD